jgi:hypothetical protein
MAVIFDFEAGKGFHFTSAFAKRFECKATGDRVLLSALLGEGFIQEVYAGPIPGGREGAVVLCRQRV